MALVAPIDLTQFNLHPEPATFGPLWAQFFSDVDSMDAPLAALEAAQTGVDIVAALGALEPIESGISDALGAFPTDTGAGDLDTITGNAAAIDNATAGAQVTINDAGNTGAGIGISIPPITGITVTPPTQPPPPPLPPVGGGGIGGVGGTFSISLSKPDGTFVGGLWHVGDSFLIRITGTPGADIYVTATHNRATQPKGSMGVLGASGVLDIRGQFGNGDIGAWVEDWYHGTTLIEELAFEVFR